MQGGGEGTVARDLLSYKAAKVWLRGHFSAAMAPEALHPGRDPTLPGEVKATSKQLFYHISSAGGS